MVQRVVSVGEFATGAEAALAQGLLEDEGIEAEISGETAQAWAYGLGPLTQAVRLEVRIEDAERALHVLRAKEEHIRARVSREIDEERGKVLPPQSPLPASGLGAPVSQSVPESGEPPQDAWEEEVEEERDGDAVPEPSPADRVARRLFIGSVLGFCVGYVMLATLILWIVRPPPEDGLSERGRRHRRIATILVVLWAVKLLFLLVALRSMWVLAI
jgi:hypothetical protein